MNYLGYGQTDKGLTRKSNQDFWAVSNERSMYIVADGMGGALGGEIASQTVVQTFLDFFESNPKPSIDQIKQAFSLAHQDLVKITLQKPELFEMGTTVVLLWIIDEIAHIAHIGDSRAYLFRNQKIHPITKDHSIRQEYLDAQMISQKEYDQHPLRNVITRFIGPSREYSADFQSIPIQNKDIFILSTDGLHGELKDREIESLIQKEAKSVASISSKLIDLANQHGGNDNITTITISCESSKEI